MMREIAHASGTLRCACVLSHVGMRTGTYEIRGVGNAPVLVADVVALPDGYTLAASSDYAPMAYAGENLAADDATWNGDILLAVETEWGPCSWQPSEPIDMGECGAQPVLVGHDRDGRMVALVCPMVVT